MPLSISMSISRAVYFSVLLRALLKFQAGVFKTQRQGHLVDSDGRKAYALPARRKARAWRRDGAPPPHPAPRGPEASCSSLLPLAPRPHQIGAVILGPLLGLVRDMVSGRGSSRTRGNVVLSWPRNEARPYSSLNVFFFLLHCFLLVWGAPFGFFGGGGR